MTPKHTVDIEKLAIWAYQSELPKRKTSSADGIWDRLAQYGSLGGINPDPGYGQAQRYPHFGLPHPDAERIERAVSALPNGEIDWRRESEAILGELAGLVSINRPPERRTRISWVYPRSTPEGREERGARHRERLDPPRDVLMVQSLSTAALVTVHAAAGSRPDWREAMPQAYPTPAPRGPGVAVIGECKGRNRYSIGSYCPLRWDPSPISVAQARADYLTWHRGLQELARGLELASFVALPPAAPEMPWHGDTEPPVVVYWPLWPAELAMLPLKPERERTGPRWRRRKPAMAYVAEFATSS